MIRYGPLHVTPWLVDRWSGGYSRRAGAALAVNGMGCILGPLAAGFVLLPWMGERWALFVLSLKAGGTGLTLTNANHVFHFDRWWNPAVENQATDRAFRIGQRRDVFVHKFVCGGTFEEALDELIANKAELAEAVVGAGEAWITEMSNAELRALFALRRDAVSEE